MYGLVIGVGNVVNRRFRTQYRVKGDVLGRAYLEKGMYEEALVQFKKVGDSPFLIRTYLALGNRNEALKEFKKVDEESKREYVPPIGLARAFVAIGDNEKAIRCLQKAVDNHESLLNIKVDPALDPLRSDPRFQELLRRMNF